MEKPQRESKKEAKKEKEQQPTGSGSHRFSAAGSKIMLNYARRSRESKGRRVRGSNNNIYNELIVFNNHLRTQ